MWNRLEKLDLDNRLTDSNDGDAAGESEALKANLRDAAQQALGGRVNPNPTINLCHQAADLSLRSIF
jgi:hypothetical protein